LADAGWKIERHSDHFPEKGEVDDTAWISFAGKKRWVILGADRRIRYNPAEKKALLESGTHIFLVAGRNNRNAREMAQAFIRTKAKILRAIKKQRPPAIFKVYADEDRVELWLTA
jgi:hypothetical protein